MKLNNISTGILIVCILCGIVTAATTISDTSISVDNLILGGQTIVAYTDILNTKLSGIETFADVTDATNVNVAGAVMESDIPDQSFTNLLKNGGFESWSNGAVVAPDGWSCPAGTVARDADQKLGTYSLKLTRSGANAYMHLGVADGVNYAGRTMTFGCWVKTSVADKCYIRLKDSIGESVSSDHPGDNVYRWLTVTRTIDAASTNVYTRLDLTTTNGDAFFDGAILVEGLVCPAASPKPLADDGIMLQSHTPSSASDYGVDGQWCYDDDYIYVCNATDTWIRTPLSTW